MPQIRQIPGWLAVPSPILVDLPMDFADATLLVAAEITESRDIISIDSDFFIYRLQRQHLNNILFRRLILGVFSSLRSLW